MPLWPFKCKHPIEGLGVERAETKRRDRDPEDPATITTYHLHCHNCGKHGLEIRYAELDSLKALEP